MSLIIRVQTSQGTHRLTFNSKAATFGELQSAIKFKYGMSNESQMISRTRPNAPAFIEKVSSNTKLCDIGLIHGTMIYLILNDNQVNMLKQIKQKQKQQTQPIKKSSQSNNNKPNYESLNTKKPHALKSFGRAGGGSPNETLTDSKQNHSDATQSLDLKTILIGLKNNFSKLKTRLKNNPSDPSISLDSLYALIKRSNVTLDAIDNYLQQFKQYKPVIKSDYEYHLPLTPQQQQIYDQQIKSNIDNNESNITEIPEKAKKKRKNISMKTEMDESDSDSNDNGDNTNNIISTGYILEKWENKYHEYKQTICHQFVLLKQETTTNELLLKSEEIKKEIDKFKEEIENDNDINWQKCIKLICAISYGRSENINELVEYIKGVLLIEHNKYDNNIRDRIMKSLQRKSYGIKKPKQNGVDKNDEIIETKEGDTVEWYKYRKYEWDCKYIKNIPPRFQMNNANKIKIDSIMNKYSKFCKTYELLQKNNKLNPSKIEKELNEQEDIINSKQERATIGRPRNSFGVGKQKQKMKKLLDEIKLSDRCFQEETVIVNEKKYVYYTYSHSKYINPIESQWWSTETRTKPEELFAKMTTFDAAKNSKSKMNEAEFAKRFEQLLKPYIVKTKAVRYGYNYYLNIKALKAFQTFMIKHSEMNKDTFYEIVHNEWQKEKRKLTKTLNACNNSLSHDINEMVSSFMVGSICCRREDIDALKKICGTPYFQEQHENILVNDFNYGLCEGCESKGYIFCGGNTILNRTNCKNIIKSADCVAECGNGFCDTDLITCNECSLECRDCVTKMCENCVSKCDICSTISCSECNYYGGKFECNGDTTHECPVICEQNSCLVQAKLLGLVGKCKMENCQSILCLKGSQDMVHICLRHLDAERW